MSNVKRVRINGELPYDWASRLTPEETQLMATYLLSPSIGIRLTWGASHMVPNPDGSNGRTAMYAFNVQGEEAIRWSALDALNAVFKRLGTASGHAKDIEDESAEQKIWAGRGGK